MKALQLTRFGLVELVEVPEPRPGDDEIVVEVVAAGICGSDLHGIHGGFLREPPVILGHELCGRTPSGELVAVDPQVSCGRCPSCRAGQEQRCDARRFVGIDLPGGFAERVAVPRRQLVVVPAGIPEHLGAFAEPLAVGLHAYHLAGVAKGARLGVIGGGAVGQSAALSARHDGVEVELAETSPARRALAAPLQITCRAELDGHYDAVIDAVGTAASHRQALAALRRGGVAVWVGNADDEAGFDARELVRREQRIVGASAYTHGEFVEAVGLLGAVPATWIEQRGLDDGVAVFHHLLAEPPETLKVVLAPARRP
jgi:threonine dehydrogenase-like Zn-dependent dehydrogenase